MTDRTRLVANQRLDLPDFDNVQGALAEYLQGAFGALLGNTGGCLSPFAVTHTQVGAAYYANVGPFYLYQAVPTLTGDGGVSYRGWDALLVRHNPALSGQASAVDYAGARAAAIANDAANAYPFLYAKPYLLTTDTAGRKKWAASAETSFSPQTRKRWRIQFKWDTTAPSANSGWAPVGRIYSWANGLGVADPGQPTITPLSVWDAPDLHTDLGMPGAWYDPAAKGVSVSGALSPAGTFSTPGYNPETTASRDAGLVQVLGWMRSRIRSVLDTAGSQAWYEIPVAGLKALKASVDVMEAQAIPWGVANWNIDAGTTSSKNLTVSQAGGIFTATLNPAPSFGYAIVTALVQPVEDVGALSTFTPLALTTLNIAAPSVTFRWKRAADELAVTPNNMSVVVFIKRT